MLTKIKTRIAKAGLMYTLKNTDTSCKCCECLYTHINSKRLPCICKALSLPCVALKSRYTSEKALSKLMAEKRAEMIEDNISIPYDDIYADSSFIQAALDKYHTDKQQGGVSDGKNNDI